MKRKPVVEWLMVIAFLVSATVAIGATAGPDAKENQQRTTTAALRAELHHARAAAARSRAVALMLRRQRDDLQARLTRRVLETRTLHHQVDQVARLRLTPVRDIVRAIDPCLAAIVDRENTTWNPVVSNRQGSGAYGLPQALPGSKMASAGPDWRTNPATQLRWMRGYVDSVYGGSCRAWAHWQHARSY